MGGCGGTGLPTLPARTWGRLPAVPPGLSPPTGCRPRPGVPAPGVLGYFSLALSGSSRALAGLVGCLHPRGVHGLCPAVSWVPCAGPGRGAGSSQGARVREEPSWGAEATAPVPPPSEGGSVRTLASLSKWPDGCTPSLDPVSPPPGPETPALQSRPPAAQNDLVCREGSRAQGWDRAGDGP